MNSQANLIRNQSPKFNVNTVNSFVYNQINKMIKPGMFSDQGLLSKLKQKNRLDDVAQKMTPQLFPQQQYPEESVNDSPINLKSKSYHCIKRISQPKIILEKRKLSKQYSMIIKPQINQNTFSPPSNPSIISNSQSPFKLSPQRLTIQQNSQNQSPTQEEDQLVQLVTISQKLSTELESFDEFISGNGIGYHQIENWVIEMKEKLKQVQQNIFNIQQNIESKSSKDSTASKEKITDKVQVINEQQIEDYLDQINQAKQVGGSQEIITALQNGILLKLQQELQEEKKQRFQIEEEASNVINIQEQEIQKLEQRIRNLEQGINT